MPGDIITTGTPPGVWLGMDPPQFLKDGDSMHLKVDHLGEQKSKVVKEVWWKKEIYITTEFPLNFWGKT